MELKFIETKEILRKPKFNKKEGCKKWRKNNPEKVNEYHIEWVKNNPEKIKEIRRKYRKNNPEKVNKSQKEWRKNNPDKEKEYNKEWRKNNPEYSKEWRNNNPEYPKEWFKNNPEKIRDYTNKRRSLGYFELFNNPFPEEIRVAFHHINNLIVIPIPERLHQSCNGYHVSIHRKKCNVILDNVYGIDFNTLMIV